MISEEVITHVMATEGLSIHAVVLAHEVRDVIYAADAKNQWPDVERVMCWEVEDPQSDVFLLTIDLPGGLRVGTTSFDMKDVYGLWDNSSGRESVRILLEFVDARIREAMEHLASYVQSQPR